MSASLSTSASVAWATAPWATLDNALPTWTGIVWWPADRLNALRVGPPALTFHVPGHPSTQAG